MVKFKLYTHRKIISITRSNKRASSARPLARLFHLQGSHIIIEEILKLLFGKHGINDLKNHGTIVLVQLINHIDLFKIGLILNSYLYRLVIKMHYLVNGHSEVSGKASRPVKRVA